MLCRVSRRPGTRQSCRHRQVAVRTTFAVVSQASIRQNLYHVFEKGPMANLALPAGVCREPFAVGGTRRSLCHVHY